MEDVLARVRRTSKLGKVGEILAAEALESRRFREVKNLNEIRRNYPYADLLAERDGHRYFIGVKSRNEERDVGGLNESYNCVLVPDAVNKRLRAQGLTPDEITKLALRQVYKLAASFNSIPAWITVPMRPTQGTYAAYFGLLSDLGNKRSIPMKPTARTSYECLVNWTSDRRITPDLSNRR